MAIITTAGVSASTPAAQEQSHADDAATAARIEQHVNQIIAAIKAPTPTEALRTLAAEHHLSIVEQDPASLPADLRDTFLGVCVERGGRRAVYVPVGQDPVERLRVVLAIVGRFGVTA